jgi:Alpha/beta hydrolase domain
MKRPLVVGAVCLVVTSAVVATGAQSPLAALPRAKPSVAHAPAVTGPVTGGAGKPNLVTTNFDLGAVGYVGEEYFLNGSATAFSSPTPLTADGKWTVTPASTAPYKTRIVVYRPANPKNFNGTVMVEWLNVSAGFDSPPDWLAGHVALIRDGAAWVGVSAQSVGVQGGQAAVAGIAAGGLKAADPARYASLNHPGDSYSYDIFSQAGLAVRSTAKPSVMAGLTVKHVIAMGESQSAFRLVTYIDAVQPRAHVYDGFLVHSRWGTGNPLSQPPLPAIAAPTGTVIRDDLKVPVLTFETETDLIRGYVSARQPDSRTFRLWEVAGTAHADTYTTGGFSDTGDGKAEVALLDVAAVTGGPLGCAKPINSGPAHLVLGAALHDLDRWVANGTPPPRASRIVTSPGPVVTIRRDGHANALGGIRTPLVDVPTATLAADGDNSGASFCGLFGVTVPFSTATLSSLYPSHAVYVTKFDQATGAALRNGFLLPLDAKNLEAAAAQSSIG